MAERPWTDPTGSDTLLVLPVGVGARSVENQLRQSLVAGPVVLTGHGHKSAVTAWQAVRAVGRHVGLVVLDATGSTAGAERTSRSPAVTRSGSTVSTRPSVTRSSRSRSPVVTFALRVEVLPAGWSAPARLEGGDALPDGPVVLDAGDVVLPGDDGGTVYLVGPSLRFVAD